MFIISRIGLGLLDWVFDFWVRDSSLFLDSEFGCLSVLSEMLIFSNAVIFSFKKLSLIIHLSFESLPLLPVLY